LKKSWNHNSLNFFKLAFLTFFFGFRKGRSSEHALLRLLHNWQANLDKSNIIGNVLIDLSKAYDCLPHDLLIAKLASYGVDHHSLTLIYDYLKHRRQRVRVGSTFSKWLEIVLGVPQGSILAPILFNIFINDLIYFAQESEICNFADDNTLYAFGKSVTEVKSTLDREVSSLLYWFDINSMAANPAKFQVMFLGTKEPISDFCIKDIYIPVSDCVKLLGITIDRKLSFKDHISLSSVCNRASCKTKALLRIRFFLSKSTLTSLCNAYILSQFNYCSMIWMGCDR